MNRQSVYKIFIEYFGEDRVDNREEKIIVYYPTLTITNEYSRSITIKDFYCRICVNDYGKLTQSMECIRTTYTDREWKMGYCHSHSPSRRTPCVWDTMCTGSGPINFTIDKLKYEPDELTWQLFVVELDKYLHTESLAGGPYKRLDEVNSISGNGVVNKHFKFNTGTLYTGEAEYVTLYKHICKQLIKSNKLNYVVKNDQIDIGNTYCEFVDIVSKIIRDDDSIENKPSILKRGIIYPTHVVYYESEVSNDMNPSRFIDTPILTFKNIRKCFRYEIDESTNGNNYVLVATQYYINNIYRLLIFIINLMYSDYGIKNSETVTSLKKIRII